MKKPSSNGQDEIEAAEEGVPQPDIKAPHCGIVMPISAIDNCAAEHWQDVKEILFDAAEMAGFEPRLVSDAEEVGIIQKRIIQNLYENPVVVCDVSGKNPNVMFELGIRLAFDKPTIIVKDDKTEYAFDTSPIEHLNYPRDLRFNRIVGFKTELAEKIAATHSRATTDPGYTTFLKHFGTFSVAKLDNRVVSKDAFILEQLQQIQNSVVDLTARVSELRIKSGPMLANRLQSRYLIRKTLCADLVDEMTAQAIVDKLPALGVSVVRRELPENKHVHIVMDFPGVAEKEEVLKFAQGLSPSAHYLQFPRTPND